ncbi:MAG: hypothetical protein JW940_39540 [Polyangiaceae bacterium]|nr:hypothetical protein [Polyangiaceae bacterium]
MNASRVFRSTHTELRAPATALASGGNLSGLPEPSAAAAAEVLRHLLAMARGLVDLYGLRARPPLGQPS